jgi:CBS domain-containing protein
MALGTATVVHARPGAGPPGEVIPMRTIRDAMTRKVITVDRDTPLKDVAQLLIDRRISGVPVVDGNGAVLGVVSEADLLIKESGADALARRRFAWLLGEDQETRSRRAKIAAVTAGEAMTTPAVTADPDLSLAAAAQRMTDHRVNRLPIVEAGRIVGIVTRADLIRAFVRSDADIAATIGEEILHRILWLDPAGFTIAVRDGVVTIRGGVERRSTAEAIEHAIAMVPGVVGVVAELPWSLDDRRLEPVSFDPVFPFGPH